MKSKLKGLSQVTPWHRQPGHLNTTGAHKKIIRGPDAFVKGISPRLLASLRNPDKKDWAWNAFINGMEPRLLTFLEEPKTKKEELVIL